jgi:hypothetical protein
VLGDTAVAVVDALPARPAVDPQLQAVAPDCWLLPIAPLLARLGVDQPPGACFHFYCRPKRIKPAKRTAGDTYLHSLPPFLTPALAKDFGRLQHALQNNE